MKEYVGYKVAWGLRSLTIYHFKNHKLIMTTKRTPNKGTPMKDRRKQFRELLVEYKIPVPEKLKMN